MKEIDLNKIIENIEPDADITHEHWSSHRRLMRRAIEQALDIAAEEAGISNVNKKIILSIKERIK